ncbi:hypothetical protein ACFQ0X_06245 [Streptomyces rectiviolaceus]
MPLDPLDGIARYLDEQHLLVYDPTGTAGDTFTRPCRPSRPRP